MPPSSRVFVSHRPAVQVSLERDGLITLTPGKTTATIQLTDDGKQAIRTMPDDLHEDWLPRPIDITQVKAKLAR